MRHFISSSFKNLSVYWERYIFHCEKWDFEPIMNSAHMAELLALVKALHKNMEYLLYYASRKHVKCEMKTLQVQVYIQQ